MRSVFSLRKKNSEGSHGREKSWNLKFSRPGKVMKFGKNCRILGKSWTLEKIAEAWKSHGICKNTKAWKSHGISISLPISSRVKVSNGLHMHSKLSKRRLFCLSYLL